MNSKAAWQVKEIPAGVRKWHSFQGVTTRNFYTWQNKYITSGTVLFKLVAMFVSSLICIFKARQALYNGSDFL